MRTHWPDKARKKEISLITGRGHGCYDTPEYKALVGAIARCQPTNRVHAYYFDRGITVCEKWKILATGFSDFLAHIGPRPSAKHSLGRIDNNRGYEPGNVRWATAKEQANNTWKRLRLEQWSDAEIESEYRRRGLGNYSKTFRGIQLSDFPQVGSIVL